MSIRERIENNIIVVLVSCSIAAGGVAAAVDSFFWSREVKLIEKNHRNNVQAVEARLTSEISSLKTLLASIERRVGDEKLFLDVTRIPISLDQISMIAATHKSFQNGAFFVAPPDFEEWELVEASQLDLLPLFLGESASDEMLGFIGGALDPIDKKNAYLWVSNDGVEVELSASEFLAFMGIEKISLKPFVFAMQVDEELFNATAQAIAGLLSDEPIDYFSDIDVPLEEIQGIEELLSSDAVDPKEVSDELEKLTRSDLTGFMFVDSLLSNFLQCTQMFSGEFSIASAQKKGNVAYLRIHCNVAARNTDTDLSETLIIDQEIFLFATLRGGILVRTMVPSLSFNSTAYSWTQAWLNTLHIPIR